MQILHQEYKVPNGKLIVADLEIENQFLKKVQISGDFFIDPPETLDCINKALIGLPVDAQPSLILKVINSAISLETKILGFQPLDIVTIIRKALL